jgi:hypothetical protein
MGYGHLLIQNSVVDLLIDERIEDTEPNQNQKRL